MKRTRIQRKTELRAKKTLSSSGTPLRRTSLRTKRRPSVEIRAWVRLRRLVYDRDNGCCVVCGVHLTPGRWECHHRRYRSRGGRNELANLIACCFDDHHARIHEGDRLEAETNGWAIPPTGPDPTEIPVLYADGEFRYLSNGAVTGE